MRWWKVVGLAGMAGVAASGVAVARAERRRQAYTPDEVRERLHARLEELPPEPAPRRPPGSRHGPVGRGPSAAAIARLRSLRARALPPRPARPSRLLRRARARFR